jgi:hypothetical protein
MLACLIGDGYVGVTVGCSKSSFAEGRFWHAVHEVRSGR